MVEVKSSTAEFFESEGRRTYTTPTSYLQLIKTFTGFLAQERKREKARIARYRSGLRKLSDTEALVGGLEIKLKDMQPTLVAAQRDTDELLVKLERDQKDAARARALAEKDAEVAMNVQVRVQAIADDCQKDLDAAMPAYYKSIKALDALDKKAINEVKSFLYFLNGSV